MSGYVEYSSNNSGGEWWLSDEDWKNLEEAGWKVHWAYLERDYDKYDASGLPELLPLKDDLFMKSIVAKGEDGIIRYLGALAKEAFVAGKSLREAVDEWERITHKNSTAAGCPCCGNPHHFTEYDAEDHVVKSGPTIHYEGRWED